LYTSLFIEPPDLSDLEDWGIDGVAAATARTFRDKVRAELDIAVAKPPDSVFKLKRVSTLTRAVPTFILSAQPKRVSG
jgi:hypothetical protein